MSKIQERLINIRIVTFVPEILEGAAGGRPGFVDDLLALQGRVPGPAEAIGASGDVGGIDGGVASTIIAATGAAVLLAAALLVAPIVTFFGYLLG